MHPIRVVDLNIWNYNPPWPTRRELIVDLLLDLEPDVIALQEIRYRDWSIDPRHQADQILAGLPQYTAIWQPAHHWPEGSPDNLGKQWEGLAILSRHPIVDRSVALLSRVDRDSRDMFQRLVLGAEVRTPAGPFWAFNTHFPLSDRARARVALEAFDFVKATAKDVAFVFTGDFNAGPHDLPIRFLTGQDAVDGRRGDLIDAWAACHPQEPGYTFPAWGPQHRIDYAFVPSQVQVQQVDVVGAVSGRELASPSDHCGLFAVLALG